MHVQIVTFGLDGMPEGEYIDVATRLTPRFAALPGLLAKVWLESPDSGTYGGIYFWEDQEAMDRFVASDLFEGTHPAFTELDSSDFSVLGNLTRATQPGITLLEEPAPRGRAPERPLPAAARTAKKVVKAKTAKTAAVKAPAAASERASTVNKIEAVARPARPRRAATAPEPPPAPAARPRTRRRPADPP